MEEHDWAWLAGLFEGEGTIGFPGDSVSVQIRIGMTDEDVIETVQGLFPGSPFRRDLLNRKKPLFVWSISSRDKCKDFLVGVLPYLHARRRERAIDALGRLERNPGAKGLRTECVHGHPLSGDNVYMRPNGTRSCLTCRRERDRKRKR
jgi:hypothetical protein